MSKSKVVIAGIVLIVLVVIASFSAFSIVQSKTVADVASPVAEEVRAEKVSFKWKRVSGADGYYIYQSPSGENSFEKIATVKGEGTNKYTVDKLEQATDYDFYITAFKNTSADEAEVESKNYETVKVTTLPSKQNVTKADSVDEGTLTAEWEINAKATGYVVQYVKGDGSDFGEATSKEIADKAKANVELKELEVKANYAIRVRTYIAKGENVIYGEWSEPKTVKIADKIAVSSTVDASKPMIALTFDDGPLTVEVSEKILDTLEKYNARATFFMVGNLTENRAANLKRKVQLHCEIGNHTWNHEHYGKNVTAQDISKASDAIEKACGQRPTAFRSPGGNTTETIRNECKKENMALYYWSLDTEDWKYRNADHVYKAVMNNVQDGDIILMHEIYPSTAEAVERMVPELVKKGYQLVTCEELIKAKTGKEPEAGTQYLNATTVKNETS